jgi:hypothetical protein
MHIPFPYRDINSLEIPDKNLLGVFSPATVQIEKSEEEIVEEAFSRPIGSEPLSKMLRGYKNLLGWRSNREG